MWLSMVRRVARKLVQEFAKETEKHKIRLIAGIHPEPPKASNAIFYVRMESEDKDTGETCFVEPIWLTLNEMVKLSVLMTLASKFWAERLEKGSSYSQKRIKTFVHAWNQMSDTMDDLLEKRC